jgi:hypothetical protein
MKPATDATLPRDDQTKPEQIRNDLLDLMTRIAKTPAMAGTQALQQGCSEPGAADRVVQQGVD